MTIGMVIHVSNCQIPTTNGIQWFMVEAETQKAGTYWSHPHVVIPIR